MSVRLAGAAALLLALAGCINQCKPYRGQRPQALCILDAGLLRATNYSDSVTLCEVKRDAGFVEIALSGSDCGGSSSSAPHPPHAEITCDVSGLDAGSYITVIGSGISAFDLPFEVPFVSGAPDGGGLRSCTY